MTNLPKRPRDTAQLAKLAPDMATGEVENDQEQVLVEALHAQEQRRRRSGQERAGSQTAERRSEIAKRVASVRWGTSATT